MRNVQVYSTLFSIWQFRQLDFELQNAFFTCHCTFSWIHSAGMHTGACDSCRNFGLSVMCSTYKNSPLSSLWVVSIKVIICTRNAEGEMFTGIGSWVDRRRSEGSTVWQRRSCGCSVTRWYIQMSLSSVLPLQSLLGSTAAVRRLLLTTLAVSPSRCLPEHVSGDGFRPIRPAFSGFPVSDSAELAASS